MSGGVIAAIVVSIAVFILLVVLAVCLYRRYRQRQQPSFPPPIYNQQMPPYQPNYNGGVQPLSANRLAGPHNVNPYANINPYGNANQNANPNAQYHNQAAYPVNWRQLIIYGFYL